MSEKIKKWIVKANMGVDVFYTVEAKTKKGALTKAKKGKMKEIDWSRNDMPDPDEIVSIREDKEG